MSDISKENKQSISFHAVGPGSMVGYPWLTAKHGSSYCEHLFFNRPQGELDDAIVSQCCSHQRAMRSGTVTSGFDCKLLEPFTDVHSFTT